MRKHRGAIAVWVGFCAILLLPHSAQAQGYGSRGGGVNRGPVSPALSLGGRNPAFNYLNIYRPEMTFQNALNQQSLDIQRLQQRQRQPERDPALRKDTPLSQDEFWVPPTGHRVYFNNTSHYYPQQMRR